MCWNQDDATPKNEGALLATQFENAILVMGKPTTKPNNDIDEFELRAELGR